MLSLVATLSLAHAAPTLQVLIRPFTPVDTVDVCIGDPAPFQGSIRVLSAMDRLEVVVAFRSVLEQTFVQPGQVFLIDTELEIPCAFDGQVLPAPWGVQMEGIGGVYGADGQYGDTITWVCRDCGGPNPVLARMNDPYAVQVVSPGGGAAAADGRFGGLDVPVAVVAHRDGVTIIDLDTGDEVATSSEVSFVRGAVAMDDPAGGPGTDGVLASGLYGAAFLPFDGARLGPAQPIPGQVGDVAPFGSGTTAGDSAVHSVLFGVGVVVPDGAGGFEIHNNVVAPPPGAGTPFGQWGPDPDGPLFAVSAEGNAGTLWYHDRADDLAPMEAVDTAAGRYPEHVACLDGICAVADSGDDQVITYTWDGVSAPVRADVAPAGNGSAHLALRTVPGGVQILTADTFADGYTVIDVDSDGTVLSSTSTALDPADCDFPLAAAWEPGGTALLACRFSGTLVRVGPF